MKTKLWPIITALVLAIVLLPAPAQAEPVTAGGFTIAYTEDEGTPQSGTDYTYDSGVLTITTEEALTISTTGEVNGRIVIGLDSSKTATLTLAGVNITAPAGESALSSEDAKVILTLAEGTENTLTGGGSDNDDGGHGICVDDNLTIQGSGQLTATGGNGNGTFAEGGAGIYCDNNLTISGGSVVKAIGNEGNGELAEGGAGIYSYKGKIYISDNSFVTATGGNSPDYNAGAGIYCKNGSIEISGYSTVTANGGNSSGDDGGEGIHCETTGGITVSGNSTVTANGGGGGGSNRSGHGIYSYKGKIEISGNSTVKATGGDSPSYEGGDGIRSYYGGIVISGTSTVTANGGDGGGRNRGGHGLYSNNGNISISDNSTVTATGGDSPSYEGGNGIRSTSGKIDISGNSTVTATGGDGGGGNPGGDGIYCGNTAGITISGSTVTATGGNSTDDEGGYGIRSTSGSIDISENSTVTANGGDGGGNDPGGDGIYCGNTAGITISGSTVTATGGDSSDYNAGRGIYCNKGGISISDSIVTATGGNSTTDDGGSGLYVPSSKTLEIGDAAVVTAEAGAGKSTASAIGGSGMVTKNGLLFTKDSDASQFTAEISASGAVTPSNDFTVPGCELTIPAGTTLTVSEDVTMTNEGTVVVNGTLNVYGTLDNSKGTISGNITIQPGGRYITAVDASSLTATPAPGSTATVDKDGNITFTGSGTATLGEGDDKTIITAPATGGTLTPTADGITVPADTTIQTGTGPAIVTGSDGTTVQNDGTIILPANGTATLGDGDNQTTITAPTGGGTLTPTADGVTVPADTTIQTGTGPAIVAGPEGATIHSDGSLTLPSGGSATIDEGDDQITITTPEGGTLIPTADGWNLPAGSSVTIGGDTTTLPEGGTLTLTDGTYTLTVNRTEPPYTGIYNYPVTLPTDTDHGSITVAKEDLWATDGEKITITVTPDAGYRLDKLIITDKAGNKVAYTDNGDGTITFTMPASGVSIDATFVVDPDYEEPTDEPTLVEDRFVDVAADAWYRDAVQYVVAGGIMTGTSATTFEPQTATTRAMIVSMLHRLENNPTASTSDFTDVAAGSWYADPVAWAAAEGIVGGYEDDTFQPNRTITREELASILYRYAEYKGLDTSARADLSIYTDAPSPWAYDVMAWANAEGLINGRTETTIDAQSTLTRAECAAIFERFLG